MSRKYTLLMTGDRTGLVGEHGNTFAAHPAFYDRLDVVELTPMNEAAPELYEALAWIMEDPAYQTMDYRKRAEFSALMAKARGE